MKHHFTDPLRERERERESESTIVFVVRHEIMGSGGGVERHSHRRMPEVKSF
jgi:hypothetical protein